MSGRADPEDAPAARRARFALACGAAAGLSLATLGLLRGPAPESALSPHAVALVNGQEIDRAPYERLVARIEAERGRPLAAQQRRHVLERMIDEALLVQRGVSLGLVEHDGAVRKSLSSAVIQLVTTESEAREPSPDEVERFYAEHQDYFSRPGQVHGRHLRIPIAGGDGAAARARAEQARARIQSGESFARVARELAAEALAPLPDTPLPVRKLADYLGATLANTLLALESPGLSEPVRVGDAWHLVELVAREPGGTPPLRAIEVEVRDELRRRAADSALRRELEELRRTGDVRIAEPHP